MVFLVSTAGCDTPPEPAGQEPDETSLRVRADALARQLLIVDTHIDVPYRMDDGIEDISVRTAGGDFDFPRASAGGLNVAFMSVYVPAEMQLEPAGTAKRFADGKIDLVEGLERDWPDKFAIARTTADLAAHQHAGLISMPMGMENGAGIEDDLANLGHFYDRGIRYITLTHSKVNQICDSSYDPERTWHGLSPFGREVVAEMNRLGIMIDISHVSDEAFFEAVELSRAPVIASHSSCRHFTPGWERNMSDEMIRRLAENGGVIQINFGSSFLDDDYRRTSERVRQQLTDDGLQEGSEEYGRRWKQLASELGLAYADVTDVVAHIDHVVELVGVDHVGLGSDFDGVGDSLPTGLKDVSAYPNLILELLRAGYSEDDIAGICGGNLIRVWKAVEEVGRTASPANDE